jgi:hypothetical protein
MFVSDTGSIRLSKFSVVTYLHAFKSAQLQHGEVLDSSDEWATTLFVRMFPISAARMLVTGSFIVTPETAAANNLNNLPKLAGFIAEAMREAGVATVTDPEVGDDTPHLPASVSRIAVESVSSGSGDGATTSEGLD